MTFQLLDQVVVSDQKSEHFAKVGRVYGISLRDGVSKYDVELTGPRPPGYLWFVEAQLELHTCLVHAELLERRNLPGDVELARKLRGGSSMVQIVLE